MADYDSLLQEVAAAKRGKAGPPGEAKSPGVGGGASDYDALLGELHSFKNAPVVEEMHPLITAKDRFVIQNFANKPEVGVEYLQKKYPDLQVKLDPKDGRMLMKTPTEKEFRVLDPNTGFFSSDFLNDASDLAYSGLATGLQTAASVPGALVGSVPGAIAAGGATGAGLEALRQKLGQYYGLPQEVSGKDVLTSGAVGAAIPAAGAAVNGITQLAAKTAPSWMPALGKAAGGYVGHGAGLPGALVGSEVGGELASKLVTPGAMEAMAPVGQAIQSGTKRMLPAIYGGGVGAWKALYDSEKKKESRR